MEYEIPQLIRYKKDTKMITTEVNDTVEVENQAYEAYLHCANSVTTEFALYKDDTNVCNIVVDSYLAFKVITDHSVEKGKLQGNFKIGISPRGDISLVSSTAKSLVPADTLVPGYSYYIKGGNNMPLVFLCTSPLHDARYPFQQKRKVNWFVDSSYGEQIVHNTYSKSKLLKSHDLNAEKLEFGITKLQKNDEFFPKSIVNTELRVSYLKKSDLIRLLNYGRVTFISMTKYLTRGYNEISYNKHTGSFTSGRITDYSLLSVLKQTQKYDEKTVKLINNNYLHD